MPANKTGRSAIWFRRRKAARLETYGPEAVKIGDKCFTKQTERGTGSYEPTSLDVQRGEGTK
jgi:hypothetical protein